jgi:hypothetical protein
MDVRRICLAARAGTSAAVANATRNVRGSRRRTADWSAMKVLVTGGTDVLGRNMVRLLDGKAEVRVLSRGPSDRPGFVKGDLDTGNGLATGPVTREDPGPRCSHERVGVCAGALCLSDIWPGRGSARGCSGIRWVVSFLETSVYQAVRARTLTTHLAKR